MHVSASRQSCRADTSAAGSWQMGKQTVCVATSQIGWCMSFKLICHTHIVAVEYIAYPCSTSCRLETVRFWSTQQLAVDAPIVLFTTMVSLCKLLLICNACGTGEGAVGASPGSLPGGARQPASHSAAAGCAGRWQLPQPRHFQCTRFGPAFTNRPSLLSPGTIPSSTRLANPQRLLKHSLNTWC